MALSANTRPASSGLDPIDRPELVFGLVGAVGANLVQVREVLEEELRKVSYQPFLIHVTDLLYEQKLPGLPKKGACSEKERISGLMDAGNLLRRQTGRNDVMALLAIYKIRQVRAEIHKKTGTLKGLTPQDRADRPVPAAAYIVHSLKTPEEIQALRDTYGRAFMVVAAYQPRETRAKALAKKIRTSTANAANGKYVEDAWSLVQRDEKENDPFGQNIRDSFPQADLFVDASSKERVKPSVKRFVELLFGHTFHTPTRDEAAMFHARSAALRSADLGRQVGCSLTTSEGDVIAIGCNEVPRAGGGLYWPDDDNDQRDFRVGFDSSDVTRREIVTELVARLKAGGWLKKELVKKTDSELGARLLDGPDRLILAGAQVSNVIEFGRSVHAEMAAIADAAKRGIAIAGATMYCTTFPCHICARHIVASGICRLVYIEPYPKSKTEDFYSDSVILDPSDWKKTTDRVSFESFVGIGPNNYRFLFRLEGDRKDPKGNAVTWRARDATPKMRRFVHSYILIENDAIRAYLRPALIKANIRVK